MAIQKSIPSVPAPTAGSASRLVAALTAPGAPRAFIVSLDRQGQIVAQPLGNDQSVLDLSTELISHLNDYPHSTGYLAAIRDAIDQRLEMRRRAQAKTAATPRRRSIAVTRTLRLPMEA